MPQGRADLITHTETGGMEVEIKNIINMMYSRDASKKVMAAG